MDVFVKLVLLNGLDLLIDDILILLRNRALLVLDQRLDVVLILYDQLVHVLLCLSQELQIWTLITGIHDLLSFHISVT